MNKDNDSDTEKNKIIKFICVAITIISLLFFNYWHFSKHISSNPEQINNYIAEDNNMDKFRYPAVAGIFYPAKSSLLEEQVGKYLNSAQKNNYLQPKILIVPHAGYTYSAQTAAKAYAKLLPWKDKIHNVIILGPAHYVAIKGAALSKADYFTTPLGKIAVNKEINAKLINDSVFSYNKAAHSKEHSLEVQLPFLQKTLNDFSIVPIVYGEISPTELAKILLPHIQSENTLLVVSADLSHYHTYNEAQVIDNQTNTLVKNNLPVIENHMSCGAIGINTAILLAQESRLQPKLLDMINSGDVGGDKSSVVGYASWLFEKKEDEKKEVNKSALEKEVESLRSFVGDHGQELFKIAKIALDDAIIRSKHFKPTRDDYANALFNKGATFVTLNKEGKLRGCIGSLLPSKAVAFDVAQNTYSAALEDNRFTPITPDELSKIKISISLLTDFEPINYKNEEDLVEQLIQGVDGVVIRDGNRQGVFLPSVWKQLPNPQEFLNNLKIKAGMSPSYWSNRINVYRFRVVEISKDED